ncbi:MAG: hypothetical protein JW889_15570 [Verrucomicrobia bacterium]|nr:hypothetical protein [Verrucomicrobiota bacterium]
MTPLLNRLLRRGNRAISEVLDPLAAVPGVTDYALLDAAGGVLARTSNFGYTEERLRECGAVLRRTSTLVNEYLCASPRGTGDAAPDEPLALHFRNGWLLAWLIGGALLIVFGREGLDLPTLRMRVSILRTELTDDKRFRRSLAERRETGPAWLRQTAASETERCWIDAICGEGRT